MRKTQVNERLRCAILAKFDKQCDFAYFLRVSDYVVSRAVHNRLVLKPRERQRWARALGEDENFLFPQYLADRKREE